MRMLPRSLVTSGCPAYDLAIIMEDVLKIQDKSIKIGTTGLLQKCYNEHQRVLFRRTLRLA